MHLRRFRIRKGRWAGVLPRAGKEAPPLRLSPAFCALHRGGALGLLSADHWEP